MGTEEWRIAWWEAGVDPDGQPIEVVAGLKVNDQVTLQVGDRLVYLELDPAHPETGVVVGLSTGLRVAIETRLRARGQL
ncbi:MAG TPA: hypothetical protein VJT49_10530 [Amycolatopsis sp.]|uniref:hypothetical protein n=1 Tax=Amycolatopsis sp. TaxID=37632 RepID=UPI002B46E79D|nr:hypothetical protein [Amycolatopsis sp.]HKS45530.1 hypothetical protein [Amycolatopsis sp.]